MLTKIFHSTLAVLTVSIFAVPTAYANQCFDLWVERNAIFKKNGYCFGSTLGKTYFGNSGCYTKNARLSSSERRRVSAIKRQERALGCRINTRQAYRGSGSDNRPAQSRQPSRQVVRSYSCSVSCLDQHASFGKQHQTVRFSVNAASHDSAYNYALQNHNRICNSQNMVPRFVSNAQCN